MYKDLPRSLKILLVSMVVANVGTRVYRPFLPLFILDLGGSVADLGLFFTINTVVTALARPFGGWISDGIGRLQAVGIGTVFGFIGFLGFALAPTWQWLLVLVVPHALGRGLVGPSFQAYIAEVAPEGKTAQTFGLVNGTFSLVDVIGPLLGGWLASIQGLRAIFWLAFYFMAAASVLRLAVAFRLPYTWHKVSLSELKQGGRNLVAAVTAGGLLTFIFIDDILADFSFQLYDNLTTVFLDTNGLLEDEIGFLLFIFAVVYVLTSIIGSRLADRTNPAVTLAIGSSIVVAGVLALVNVSDPKWFYVYFALRGMGLGIADPSFQSLLAKAAPQGQMGLTFGLFRATVNIFSTPAPYLGSLLWAQYNPTIPFWVGAVLLFLEALFAVFVLRPKASPHFMPSSFTELKEI